MARVEIKKIEDFVFETELAVRITDIPDLAVSYESQSFYGDTLKFEIGIIIFQNR